MKLKSIKSIDILLKCANSEINQDISQQLRQLARLQDNIWKATAYTTAARSIEQLDTPITEIEDLKSIEGVGSDISKEIEEYLETGSIKKLIKQQQTEEATGKRIPVNEVLSKTKNFFQEATKKGLTYEIVGSIRRKEKQVKDIDIIVLENEMHDWTNLAEQTDNFRSKGKEQLDFNYNGIQINVWAVPENEFGSAILFYTGPKSFNVYIAKEAQKKGYKLNRHGLFDQNDKRLSVTEKQIFDILDIPFIEPDHR